MPLTASTRLGPYEIVAPLGAGGMGEVYRARDTRLGRDVAIKVLPHALAEDSAARARFEREARTISSLNHPHICVLFDVGEERGVTYLVMELIEGESLAARLGRGPLTAAQTLKLGVEIADALDRAHRAGIVHRDLKPANVMLTKSGAKLMDFGLARPSVDGGPPSAGDLTQSPTITHPLTGQGVLLGTYPYMSPEQVDAREADARSDLWALGCVLYETASGRRAFEGRSQASLIAAILERDPPPVAEVLSSRSGSGTGAFSRPEPPPPELERAIRQCLAKDPDERWQTAGDLKRELEWISRRTESGAEPVAGVRRPHRRPGWPMVATGAAIGAVVASLVAAFGPWHGAGERQTPASFALTAPSGYQFATPAEPALTPDGTKLAFTAQDSTGTSVLFLRTLDATRARVLPGTMGASLPFWSPDGRALGFFARGKLLTVGLDGTAPVALCDAPDARGGSWSRDGVIVFAPGNQGPIARVAANGGTPVTITRLDTTRHELGHRYPQFLPDGKHFLYVAIGNTPEQTTFAGSVAGGTPVEICKAATAGRYAPPGHLLYLDGLGFTNRRLLARRFDPGRLKASGDAVALLQDIGSINFGYSNLATDAHGTLVVQRFDLPRTRLEWRTSDGRPSSSGPELKIGLGWSLSPDGTRLAFGAVGPQDLYVHDFASGITKRLTFHNRLSISSATWSPDARRIAYSWEVENVYRINLKNADGSGPDTTLFRGPGLFAHPLAWSHDGSVLLAQVSNPSGEYDLWTIPVENPRAAAPYQVTPANEQAAVLSPDGRWLASIADDNGERTLSVQSFPAPGALSQIPVDDPVACLWRRDDELIVMTQTNGIYAVPMLAGVQHGPVRKLYALPAQSYLLDVDPRTGRHLVGRVLPQSADASLDVVLGWPALLHRR